MILRHELSARRPKAVFLIGLTWAVLLLLWLLMDAALWILIPIGIFTVPAIFEAARGDVAEFHLTEDALAWKSARHTGEAPLRDIDHVRFDTRLAFAINARPRLVDGTTIRLPVECVPPYAAFCAALDTAGVRHERHHFSFFNG